MQTNGIISRALRRILGRDEWRQAPHFPDYAVSRDGRVWSAHVEREKETYPNQADYPVVDLYDDGRRKQRLLHALVTETWMPEKYRDCIEDGSKEIHHVDGDSQNAAVSNLEIIEPERNREIGDPAAPTEDDDVFAQPIESAPF